MIRTVSIVGASILGVSLLLAATGASDRAAAQKKDGPIGKVQQPIVAGTLVDNATQKNLGLVTVAGGCSGTLLNRYWVLTADHCIATRAPRGPAESQRSSERWQGFRQPAGFDSLGEAPTIRRI